jgi:hypothetical protein
MSRGTGRWSGAPIVATALLAVACSLASCSAHGPSADIPDGGIVDTDCAQTLDGSDAPIFDQTNSRFTLTGDGTYLELSGAIYDGPAVAFHRESDRIGACRLLTYEATSCDPPCTGGDVCIDEECASYPSLLSAGTATLSGVGDAPVEIAPSDALYSWLSTEVGVDDVAAIRVQAEGDTAGAFDLTTCVIAPPEPEGDWSAAMEARGAGEDVTLTWSNPYSTSRIYLRMTTGIGTHGGISPVEIECEGPDTGSLTLPGAFLDLLYNPSYWSCGECGDNRLLRYHATEAEVGGTTVQLRTQSPAMFYFRP